MYIFQCLCKVKWNFCFLTSVCNISVEKAILNCYFNFPQLVFFLPFPQTWTMYTQGYINQSIRLLIPMVTRIVRLLQLVYYVQMNCVYLQCRRHPYHTSVAILLTVCIITLTMFKIINVTNNVFILFTSFLSFCYIHYTID